MLLLPRMRSRRGHNKRLAFEQLEVRWLMAVTVTLNDGTLSISGDSAADDIAIVGTATPGEITVIGRNGTVVKDIANGRTTIAGVTADLRVALHDGNNVLNMDNVYIAGNILITMGDGRDSVILGESLPISPAGDLSVSTGSNDDLLIMPAFGAFVGRDAAINLESGETDVAFLHAVSAREDIVVSNRGSVGYTQISIAEVTVGRNLITHSLGRTGSISILKSSASQMIQANGRQGVNGGHNVYIDTCFAGFFIQIETLKFESLDELGIGIATVSRCLTSQMIVRSAGAFGPFNGVTLYGNLVIGPPYYHASPMGLTEAIYVETGNDGNKMEIAYNVTYDRLFALLGDGDDSLKITGNEARRGATLDGGLGTDSLTEAGNAFGSRTLLNFP